MNATHSVAAASAARRAVTSVAPSERSLGGFADHDVSNAVRTRATSATDAAGAEDAAAVSACVLARMARASLIELLTR